MVPSVPMPHTMVSSRSQISQLLRGEVSLLKDASLSAEPNIALRHCQCRRDPPTPRSFPVTALVNKPTTTPEPTGAVEGPPVHSRPEWQTDKNHSQGHTDAIYLAATRDMDHMPCMRCAVRTSSTGGSQRALQGSAGHHGHPAPGTSFTLVASRETPAHCTHARACDRGTDGARGAQWYGHTRAREQGDVLAG